MNGASIFARATVVDVLRAANVVPPHNTARLMRCPLPSHLDDTPSFRAFERGYRCFGCGARGGVADLVVALGFADNRAEAALWLEERVP